MEKKLFIGWAERYFYDSAGSTMLEVRDLVMSLDITVMRALLRAAVECSTAYCLACLPSSAIFGHS